MLLLKGSTHEPNYEGTAYHLHNFIDPRSAKQIVKQAVELLQQLDFDAIAFRGLSGALIAPTIAMEMGKSLIAVRKTKGDHSSRMMEGDKAARRYVIVDDFISSGRTVKKILDEVHAVAPEAECLGVLCANRLAYTEVKLKLTDSYFFSTDEVEDWKRERTRNNNRAKRLAALEARGMEEVPPWNSLPAQSLKWNWEGAKMFTDPASSSPPTMSLSLLTTCESKLSKDAAPWKQLEPLSPFTLQGLVEDMQRIPMGVAATSAEHRQSTPAPSTTPSLMNTFTLDTIAQINLDSVPEISTHSAKQSRIREMLRQERERRKLLSKMRDCKSLGRYIWPTMRQSRP